MALVEGFLGVVLPAGLGGLDGAAVANKIDGPRRKLALLPI